MCSILNVHPPFVSCICKELNGPRGYVSPTTAKEEVDGEILEWDYAFSGNLEYANCSPLYESHVKVT